MHHSISKFLKTCLVRPYQPYAQCTDDASLSIRNLNQKEETMSSAAELPSSLPDFLHDEETASLKRSYKKKKRDRNKSRMKSSDEEFDPQSQPRKRKRTISSKLKALTASEYIPLKRPRGRPPLNLSLGTATNNFIVPSRVVNKSHMRRPDIAPSGIVPPIASTNLTKNAKAITDQTENEGAKIHRPHSALVTQRILNRLMTEGPLSVADFLSPGADAPPRDLVQSILDVLQVTAVVVQLKLKDLKMQQLLSSSSGAVNANSTVYAMAGMAKGSEYTELGRIAEVTRKKLINAAAARTRIEKLQAIATCGSEVSPSERIQMLRVAVGEFCASDSSIEEDPLYKTVCEITSRNGQLTSSSKIRVN